MMCQGHTASNSLTGIKSIKLSFLNCTNLLFQSYQPRTSLSVPAFVITYSKERQFLARRRLLHKTTGDLSISEHQLCRMLSCFPVSLRVQLVGKLSLKRQAYNPRIYLVACQVAYQVACQVTCLTPEPAQTDEQHWEQRYSNCYFFLIPFFRNGIKNRVLCGVPLQTSIQSNQSDRPFRSAGKQQKFFQKSPKVEF